MIKYISQKLSIPERYLKLLSQEQLKNIKILVDLNKLKEARNLYTKYQLQNNKFATKLIANIKHAVMKTAGDVIPLPIRQEEPTPTFEEPAKVLSIKPRSKGFMDLTIDKLSTIIEKFKNKEISAEDFATKLLYIAAETQEELFKATET